jgi:hypothetical protein
MASEPLPGDYPINLYRGDTRVWSLAFTEDDGETAIDMSGKTWRAQVRETPDSASALMDITVDAADAADGLLELTLPATEWAGVASETPSTKWAWDLESTESGVVRTYLKGKVKIIGDVSRGA